MSEIHPSRDKDFLAGGEKKGCCYSIGEPALIAGRMTVAICEGAATASSVYEATRIGTIVAFDRGNLKPVAQNIRRLSPDVAIIIAADNDQFTAGNPGLTDGEASAAAVGGFLAVPAFANLDGNPTDFNDLHAREGLPAVAVQIMSALAIKLPAPLPEPKQPADPVEKTKDQLKAERAATREAKVLAAQAHAKEYAANPGMFDGSKWFTILGHDHTSIYVYSNEMKLVVDHKITAWNKQCLVQIARPEFWQGFNVGPAVAGAKPPWDDCVAWLIDQAYRKGFYDPSMTRGRGAWLDEDRIVYHFGNMLMVDGVETEVTAIDSKYVYEQGKLLPPPADTALTDEEGRRIFEIAKMFRWTKPGSAVLLTGWIALAPICGALKWRPHAWITGAAGSGKSWILNEFVSVLMSGTAIFSQGNSTVAGIRQKLQSDALPVLFDESEQGDEKAEQRVQNVIALARQSSSESGAHTYKGTVTGEGQQFLIRSMFCLSSIAVHIKSDADRDRLTVMALRPRTDNSEADRWDEIKEALHWLKRDEDLPARLMRRALDLLPITQQNIEIFAAAAAKKFGSQREGDQYGALMAGAWSMVSGHVATPDQAMKRIEKYDWSEYVEHTETDDSAKALAALLGALIRGPRGESITVYELVCRASGQLVEGCGMEPKEAGNLLRRHGLAILKPNVKTHESFMFVSNTSSEVPKLLAGTPFAEDFKGHLLRNKAARRHDGTVSMNGTTHRGVEISLEAVLADEIPQTPTIQLEQCDGDAPF